MHEKKSVCGTYISTIQLFWYKTLPNIKGLVVNMTTCNFDLIFVMRGLQYPLKYKKGSISSFRGGITGLADMVTTGPMFALCLKSQHVQFQRSKNLKIFHNSRG